MNSNIIKIVYFWILFSLLINGNLYAQAREYVMKAVAIEKIARYVSWPEYLSMEDTTNPFIITIIGTNPFGLLLEEIYKDKKIKNKPVIINTISTTDEIKNCHILFIATSEETKISEAIHIAYEKSILTMAETEGFAEKGVLIEIGVKKNKITFIINETAMKKSGIKVSALILRLAQIVNPLNR